MKKAYEKKTNRSNYVKKADKEKARTALISAYDSGGDWRSLLPGLGVSIRTAYRWLESSPNVADKRGGSRKTVINDEHLTFITNKVNANPLITLQELSAELTRGFPNVSVSKETIRTSLEKCLFSIKGVRFEPENANSPVNKEKRKVYVESILGYIGHQRPILYMDESNFNLHISRSQGRSPRGERCSVKAAATRGANIHLIGCIGPLGPLNFQVKRGSFKKDEARQYIQETLRQAEITYGRQVVLVIDNAPAHSNVENEIPTEILGEHVILRLGPYSPMLNPIEGIWSVIKAYVKRAMADSNNSYLTADRNGLSITEFRLRTLETLVNEAIVSVTPELCVRMISSVQHLFSDAILENDMSF